MYLMNCNFNDIVLCYSLFMHANAKGTEVSTFCAAI